MNTSVPLTRAAVLALALFSVPLHAAGARTEISLNADWRFHFGDVPGEESATFDDSDWSKIAVPHTWNAFDGQDGMRNHPPGVTHLAGDYARGSGWYRRVITTAPDWAGRRVYLQFDGANRRTDVFLNGQFVGTHLGGNARFRFDVTGALKPAGDNLLAVRVNNEDNEIIPHTADFTFFGGLYRNVALLVTDPVQIETMDHASPGVFLEQALVSPAHALVRARVELANHETQPNVLGVRVAILDAAGTLVREARTTLGLAAGAGGEVTLPLDLDQPHLWNAQADPYLYTARVEISVGGAVRDTLDQPLGLRFFRVDPAAGFFLNGRHLDLHGVSRHQDRLDKGWAISAADDREDFGLIAEMGCTAIRVAHYQQSPLWYELADHQGMVLWSEIPFVDEALQSKVFFNNALDQMRDLIRQNYNHPAVCFWGCGNETLDEGQAFAQGIVQYGPMEERLIQALNALVHAEDPTRLSTYASFHSEAGLTLELPGLPSVTFPPQAQRWYTDVTGMNKYYGWYYGEPEDTAVFLDRLHAHNPEQRIGVSEYGAGGSIVQHEAAVYGVNRVPMEDRRANAFAKAHPEEYQAYYHEQVWKVLQARPYVWVKFIWTMFDFASDGRDEGDHPGRNDKGMVTYDRKTRKDAFYFYQANWSTAPMVHITSSRFTPRTDPVTEVKVYTNAAAVELFVNGVSLGQKAPDDAHIVRWPGVRLNPGENLIRASAAGTPALADECRWTLTAAAGPGAG